MKTLEEVKDYFRNAKVVKSATSVKTVEIKDLDKIRAGRASNSKDDFYYDKGDGVVVSLYDADEDSIAEIVSYKVKTLEEVAEYFKDAKKIVDLTLGQVVDISNPKRGLHKSVSGYWVTHKSDDALLYREATGELAEIVSYKGSKTLEEVQEYFKFATEVRCLDDKRIYDISKKVFKGIHEFGGYFWIDIVLDNDLTPVLLYNRDTDELAEILLYDSQESEPLYKLAKEAIKAPTSEVSQVWKDKILEVCPNLKKEEESKLVKGEWYKRGEELLVWNDGYETYGFSSNGGFGDRYAFSQISPRKKADPKEVERMLIREAIKRGFKTGVNFILIEGAVGEINSSVIRNNHNFKYESDKDRLMISAQMGSYTVFKGGKWAKIVDTITLEEAEKLLGKIIKD